MATGTFERLGSDIDVKLHHYVNPDSLEPRYRDTGRQVGYVIDCYNQDVQQKVHDLAVRAVEHSKILAIGYVWRICKTTSDNYHSLTAFVMYYVSK